MKKMMMFAMAMAMAVPAMAMAQTAPANPNFSQGKNAPVLSDGASTGYNSFGQR